MLGSIKFEPNILSFSWPSDMQMSLKDREVREFITGKVSKNRSFMSE
ncbi:MAG: hypothetical protein ACJZ8U_06835 [Paracoccaceae bacterium]